MKKFLSLPFFFLVFLISIAPPKVFAQITVIDFENPPTLTTAVTSISIGGFTFAADFSLPKNIGVSSGTGFGGSRGLIDTNFDIGGLKKWTITRDGGSEFQFRSIYIQRRNAGSVSGTIQGFKNNIAVGSAKALNFDSSTSGPRDFSADPDFFDVDEIRIQGDDLYVVLDNFTYGSVFVDGATIPAEVTSINLIGAPLSNVPSVNFAVNFSKAASNVSPDDFILTRTGSANGNIATVSGSGTSFTVTVNTITGEGSLRLDLRSGTNITNANGNTGTPAFTVGQSHFVSSCLIESFEDETVGSKSFSTGVNTFTVTGNLAVYTEVPFLGIGGSKNVLKNSGVGTYTISIDNDKVVFMKTIAFYLSSAADGNAPTGSGTLTLRGKNNGTVVFSTIKNSGFETGTTNNGYTIVDFATLTSENLSAVAIDQLEIEIGGGFVYLNVDNVEFCTDTEAPAGYSVAIDQDPITTGIHNAVSFTFAGAEVGTIYNYTFSSSGGGASVTGSGTVTSPNQQITGINLSGLVEGTVTLNVTLSDASSNTGSPAIDTSAKILNTPPLATPPLAPVVNEDDLAVALSDAIQIADAENDNQVVTFTVVGGTVTLGTTGITFGGGLNGSSSFTASGTLAAINTSLDAATFTPTSDLFGTNAGSISFVSNDGTVNSNTATVTFDIAGVNDDPFITGLPSSVTVTEDAITEPFNISAVTISDIDAGSGVLTLKLEATGGVFDYASGTGILLTGQNSNAATFSGNLVDLNNYFNTPTNLYFKPNANLSGNGAATVSVFINDNGNTGSGGGTDVSAGTVSINITPVNDVPTDILLDNNSVAENEPLGTLVGSFSATDVDNGDTFTFTFAAGTGDVDNSAFSISGNELQTGAVFKFNTKNTYSIRVRVTDSGGLSLELPFTISITNVNDAPTVANPIDNQAATQDVLFEFVVPANTFEDVDGDILTYSVQLSGGGALPAWLSFDATTRTFSGTPSNTHVGTVGIDLSVSDGNGGSVTDSFDLVVANVNDAPTVANAIPNQNATEDAAFNFQFAANTFNDIDVGDALTYTAQRTGGGALPAWLSFDPVTRTFSGTPSNTNVGAVSLDVIATDGNGGSVTAMFDLVVANVNDAPTVANPIGNQAATQDVLFEFVVPANTFEDVDGDILTYSVQLSGGGALPAWLSFDATTRTFSGTPSNTHVGTVGIDLSVSDGNGGSVTDSFDLVVANVNDAPTVANAIPNQNATEDAAFNFQFAANTFNDIDVGDALTYTAQRTGGGALPGWLSFDPVTRTFSGTPSNTNVGAVSLDVIANDGNGGSVTAMFDLVVASVNDAPIVSAPITVDVTEDIPTTLTGISFTDPDAGSSPVTATFSVASGTLAASSGNGVVVSGTSGSLILEGSVSDINAFIADGQVTFTTALHATINVNLTISITDNGNTGSGGALNDQTSVTLSVTAVNDAPVNTIPGAQQTDQNVALVFSSGNGSLISVSDVDAGGETIKLSLSATNGVITLSSTSGLIFTLGSGVNFSNMEFEGTLANINTALSGMAFTPTSGFNGPASLTITSDDQGFFGSGGAQTDTDVVSITVISIIPVVTGVTSSAVNRGYKVGDELSILVNFDQAIIVNTTGGDPTLTLETGGTDREASYLSGSGSNTLVFAYTVQQGDTSSDLDYTATNALVLNGGTIENISGDAALITLPPTGSPNSLSGQKNLQIDGVIPVIASVSVPADRTYVAGETLDFTVNFSEAVVVNGNPEISLTLGSTTRVAGYGSGSGTSSLVFSYTIQSGDLDDNGIAVASLSLNGGTIRDAAGNAANLSMNGVGSTQYVLVDAVVPSVVDFDLDILSLAIGETATLSVTFTEAIIGLTTGSFTVANGSLSNLTSSDGGVSWTVIFTPDNAVEDDTNVITLESSAYTDLAGNNGLGTASSANYLVDTKRPSGTVVVDNTQLIIGESSLVTISFSEAVTGLTGIDFTVENGSLSDLSSSDGGIVWTALLIPQPGVEDATNLLSLDNTGFEDAAGNSGSGVSLSNNYSVDTDIPKGYSVSIVPARINGINETEFSFYLVDGELTADFYYSIGSSGGGTPIAGIGSVNSANQLIKDIDVSSLPDGVLTIRVTLTDSSGNTGEETTDTVDKLLPAVLTVSMSNPADEDGVDGEFEVVTDNLFAANTTITIQMGGTATPGADYQSLGTSFVFPANTSRIILPIVVVDDLIVEGNETVIVSLIASDNSLVTIGQPSQATLTIADNDLPSPLTVTIEAKQQKVYGLGDPARFNYTVTGFVNGDDESILTGKPERAAGEDVGNYAINLGSLTAGGNYTINFVGADFEIIPATLNIAAVTGQTKIYGDANPLVAYTATGFVNGDDESILTGKLERAAGEDVGSYAINLGSLSAGGNYTINFVGADFEITPATLNITAVTGQTKIYGDANPIVTYTASGFENGDDESILNGKLERAAGEDVGSYAINLGSLSAGGNYTLAYTGAEFGITPRSLTVVANPNQGKVYGENDPGLTFSANGFASGDDEGVLTGALVRATGERVDIYTIQQGSLNAGANYIIDFTSAVFQISPAVLSVNAEDKSKVYGAANPNLTFTFSGFVAGDDEQLLSGSLTREAGEGVGIYAITLGTLTAGMNYTIQFVGADFEIVPAELAVLMQPSPVETAWGISPTLPTTIMVMTADGQFLELPITWDIQTLYIFGRGVYPMTAAFNLPAGILNSNDLTPEIVVTVLPKPAPEDIVIDNNRFEAEAGQNVIAIGVLSVIDPIDDQHEITLSNLAYDNVYFAIDNVTLFWNSQESAAGKTAFKILVRAVDRDGNMLEKEFTITRNRTSVNTIEIFNTFTPNGDNVNDTWGVDELRFYQNVRIQVFERSGKRVFYTENPDVRWDGMFDGIDLPVATYYWTIQVGETGEIRKGMLNLIRN